MAPPSRCDHCGQPLPLPVVDPVTATTGLLNEACSRLGLAVSWDGYLNEAAAATVLGRQPATLRNWRYADRPIQYRKQGGRVQYALAELARWTVENNIVAD